MKKSKLELAQCISRNTLAPRAVLKCTEMFLPTSVACKMSLLAFNSYLPAFTECTLLPFLSQMRTVGTSKGLSAICPSSWTVRLLLDFVSDVSGAAKLRFLFEIREAPSWPEVVLNAFLMMKNIIKICQGKIIRGFRRLIGIPQRHVVFDKVVPL